MTSSDAYYTKGNEAFAREDYNMANDFYTKAIEIDSTQVIYYRSRANSNLLLRNYEKAKHDADKASELWITETKSRLMKGNECVQLDDIDKAIAAHTDWKDAFKDDFGKAISALTDWNDAFKDDFDVWFKQFTVKPQVKDDGEPKIVCPTASLIQVRHEWYQTEINVIVTILVKNAKPEDVSIQYTSKTLQCKVQGSENRVAYEVDINLAHAINPEHSTWKIVPSKIEIQLRKLDSGQWKTLHELQENINTPDLFSTKKNWDKVVSDYTQNEQLDEGDTGGQAFFDHLFAQSSEEARRAMNKSFIESGGTVLNSNWEQVREKKVLSQTPEGMEWKKWDGTRIDHC